jgi:hypothetical protein
MVFNKKNIYFTNNIFEQKNFNIIVLSYVSKQLKLNIKNKKNFNIFNLSVGKVLSSLNILEKKKKKTVKGRKFFIEYLKNFFIKFYYIFNNEKNTILKIKQLSKNVVIDKKLLIILYKYFNIKLLISSTSLPNNFFFKKKIKSIKKRLKKNLIKYENKI